MPDRGAATAGITFLHVVDLEASHAFYAEAVGLEQVVDQGDCRIYRIAGTAFLGICERSEPVATGGLIITIVADDVDGFHSRLVSHGVHVVKPPQHNPRYGIYHAFYRDPDGHQVEIQRFDDPTWMMSLSG